MTDQRVWVAVLLYPAPLYAGLVVLHQVWQGDVAILAGFLFAVAFGTVTAVGLVEQWLTVAVGRAAIVLFVLVMLASYGTSGGTGVDLAVGIILGSPFLWIGYIWKASSEPSARVLALQGTLFVGILCLAAGNVTAYSPGASPGGEFVGALASVLSNQVQGISALVTGGTPASMPLESTLDVNFAALGGVALVGMMVSWFLPRTAREEPLPWSWGRPSADPDPGDALVEELALRPGQREALATRTPSHPPADALPPGFTSVIVAASLTCLFVGLAVAAPTVALLTMVLGVIAAVLTVALVLSRRLTEVGGLEA